MNAKEFDEKVNGDADWFIDEMRKLNTEWSKRIDNLCTLGTRSEIPDHMMVASLNKALEKISKVSEQ